MKLAVFAFFVSLFLFNRECPLCEYPENEFGESVDSTFSAILSSDKACLVFYSAYSCTDCYGQLSKSLSKEGDVLYCLIRAPKILTMRQKMAREAKLLMPELEKVYFETSRPSDRWPPKNVQGGIFGEYDVTKGPAVLRGGKDHLVYYPYDSLKFSGR